MTHSPSCGGDNAPWCAPDCTAGQTERPRRLVDTEVAAMVLKTTPAAVRGLARRGVLTVAERQRGKRGRPTLLFNYADVDALATRRETEGACVATRSRAR